MLQRKVQQCSAEEEPESVFFPFIALFCPLLPSVALILLSSHKRVYISFRLKKKKKKRGISCATGAPHFILHKSNCATYHSPTPPTPEKREKRKKNPPRAAYPTFLQRPTFYFIALALQLPLHFRSIYSATHFHLADTAEPPPATTTAQHPTQHPQQLTVQVTHVLASCSFAVSVPVPVSVTPPATSSATTKRNSFSLFINLIAPLASSERLKKIHHLKADYFSFSFSLSRL